MENILNNKDRLKLKDYILISLSTALLAVCSYITVPGAVPFTMQTFGLFLILHVLGGKRSFISVMIYILLGTIGVPVFSGFRQGPGVIFGTTGGYIIGFILICIIYWIGIRIFGSKMTVKMILQLAGLIICYLFGTVWFVIIYSRSNGTAGFVYALSVCVLPFIIPDVVKMILAAAISKLICKIYPDMPGK